MQVSTSVGFNPREGEGGVFRTEGLVGNSAFMDFLPEISFSKSCPHLDARTHVFMKEMIAAAAALPPNDNGAR